MAQIVGKSFENRSNSRLYKELEIINFKELSKDLESDKRDDKSFVRKLLRNKSKVAPGKNAWKKQPQTQIQLFQKSMNLLLICGQCIGLHPVIGILETDITKMRFKYLSFRFLYSVLVFICQAIATFLCVYRLIRKSVSITLLAFISFFAATTITTFLFLRIAVKWPALMREISTSSLDRYVDTSVRVKCIHYSVALLATAILEHLLSQSTKIFVALQQRSKSYEAYEDFLQLTFPWFTELGVSFNIPLGITLQFINTISTINWSYSDVFIVCLSFYLTSILKQINKTIRDADKRYYHPSFWSRVREDYTKATCLIRSFDEVISGVILASFASNLFFICLQLFYVLAHGLQGNKSSSTGPLNNIENSIYFIFSFLFVLCRFLAVSFIAASVHTASLEPAAILYTVPSSAYCTEVQRFLEQIHGNTVALTGLQFFYVTKGLVLSVASTVVTYELVLLQFNDEQ